MTTNNQRARELASKIIDMVEVHMICGEDTAEVDLPGAAKLITAALDTARRDALEEAVRRLEISPGNLPGLKDDFRDGIQYSIAAIRALISTEAETPATSPASGPRVPFKYALWNEADAARNRALSEDANDHISALGEAFNVIRRGTLEEAARVCDDDMALSKRALQRSGSLTANEILRLEGAEEEASDLGKNIRALIPTSPEVTPDAEAVMALARLFAENWRQIPYALLYPDFLDEHSALTPTANAALALARRQGGGG